MGELTEENTEAELEALEAVTMAVVRKKVHGPEMAEKTARMGITLGIILQQSLRGQPDKDERQEHLVKHLELYTLEVVEEEILIHIRPLVEELEAEEMEQAEVIIHQLMVLQIPEAVQAVPFGTTKRAALIKDQLVVVE